jgi:hypothetical protein
VILKGARTVHQEISLRPGSVILIVKSENSFPKRTSVRTAKELARAALRRQINVLHARSHSFWRVLLASTVVQKESMARMVHAIRAQMDVMLVISEQLQ